MSSGKNLSAYTSGDWDALANLDSVSGATWNFVNPAGMVVSDIANVEDSNATNPVDATDNCRGRYRQHQLDLRITNPPRPLVDDRGAGVYFYWRRLHDSFVPRFT
jgi:hypothetical protein